MGTRRLKILPLIFGAVIGMTGGSCSDDREPPQESRLVVEGQIDSDGYPRVFLTLSASADADGGLISDNIVRWGKVTVSDGENEVILTGRPQQGLLPPFVYYSYDMKGEPGRTYTLTAEYGGRLVVAQSAMLSPTSIEGVRVYETDEGGLSRGMTIWFTSPDDCPAYYHLSTRVSGEDNRFYPSMLGTVAVTERGKKVEMPVYRGQGAFSDVARKQFAVGDRVTVRLARITPEAFEFWRAWDNASLTGGSVFVGSSVSLPSNINGGYGIWSAQGISDMYIEVE